jgi:hypothetical protein
MQSSVFTAVKAAVIAGVVLWAVQPINGLADPTSAGRHWAQQLQDDARILRNGARAGRGADVLSREHTRLRSDLDELVRSHERWIEELSIDERARFAAVIVEVERGCARIRAYLVDLGETLEAQPLDRRRVQFLGQVIGRQAWTCERQLAKSRSL